MSNKKKRNRLLWVSIKSIFKKEFLQLIRNPAVMVFVLLIPLIELSLLGAILDVNVKEIPTGVYDLCKTQESRRLINQFESTNDFKIVKIIKSDEELYSAIRTGEIKVALKIPLDYSTHIVEGTTASVLVLVDGSNATITAEAVNVSNIVTLQESVGRLLKGSETEMKALPIESRPSVLFNPDTSSTGYFLPGLIVFELPSITIFMVALSMAREKEEGTFEQLSLTPLNVTGFIIGKVLPYGALALTALFILTSATCFVFAVPFNGNLLLFIFLTIPFILTTLGTGLVVASGAKSQIEAMQLAILARIIPGQYLSGYIFPIESMPTFFQYVTYLFPERYLTEVSRGILLRGASIKHLWFQGLILWLMTFIMLSLAARLYRKRLS